MRKLKQREVKNPTQSLRQANLEILDSRAHAWSRMQAPNSIWPPAFPHLCYFPPLGIIHAQAKYPDSYQVSLGCQDNLCVSPRLCATYARMSYLPGCMAGPGKWGAHLPHEPTGQPTDNTQRDLVATGDITTDGYWFAIELRCVHYTLR